MTIHSVSIHFTLVTTISHLLLDKTQWNPLHETLVQAGTGQCPPQQKSVIKEQRQRKKENCKLNHFVLGTFKGIIHPG